MKLVKLVNVKIQCSVGANSAPRLKALKRPSIMVETDIWEWQFSPAHREAVIISLTILGEF